MAILQRMADAGGAEIGTTHRAVVRVDVVAGLVVFQRTLRIEREVELVFPAEVVACLAEGVVTHGRSRMSLRQIGRMGCDLVADHTGTYVLLVGQRQVFFRGDIAEHSRAIPTDHGGTYS